MKRIIIFLVFVSLFYDTSHSQIFKSNEQYSGTIDEIQDSILRKEVLAVLDCLNNSRSKNKEVKKIFSSTKDSIFTFGGFGMLCFQNENDFLTINSITVWYKRASDFPTYSYNDLKIRVPELRNEFPCEVFTTKKRGSYLFHCMDATINNVEYTVIYISDTHHGFFGRVLIKTN